jgi:hypothetical protein
MSRKDRTWRRLLAIAILLTLLLSGCQRADETAPAAPLPDLQQIAKLYKIEIVASEARFSVANTYGRIEGNCAAAESLASYARLFAPEFTLYPQELVARSQLKRVVLCTDLFFAGQRRNAVPDFEHDTIYLDVSRGSYSKPYLREVIHHEFFHVIDFRDDGELYHDASWEALNPADFKYGNGGRNAQDIDTTSVLTDKWPGFLNHYSTTGVEEDKAEMFAHMIVDSAYVEQRAKNDRVIEAKVARMKALLVSFCPEMNQQFWEKVRTMERSDEAMSPSN